MNRSREADNPQKETERQVPKDMRGGKVGAREREREKEQQKRSGRRINRL